MVMAMPVRSRVAPTPPAAARTALGRGPAWAAPTLLAGRRGPAGSGPVVAGGYTLSGGLVDRGQATTGGRPGHDFARVGVYATVDDATEAAVAHPRDRTLSAEAGIPMLTRSGIALRRQEAPADDTAQQAAQADLLCDISALCRLRATAPTAVREERIRDVAARCRPGRLILTNPCLMPEFMLAPASGAAPTAPGPTSPGPAPGGAAATTGASLASLTSFRFTLGPARFAVDLPSSATATLPVPLSGARSIEFGLNATPGTFAFSARLDGVPHVRIAARAGVDVGSQTASAGLTITTTRTVCRAVDPEAARREITAAGDRLAKAINEWQNPPPQPPGSTPPATLDRLKSVGSELGSLYQAVDRVKRPCEQRPVATFGLSTQAPFGPGPEPPETPRPATAGATLTLHF